MSENEFYRLLKSNRPEACLMLAKRKVEEWLNESTAEVVRVIANWMDDKIDLGDDGMLCGMAEGSDLIDEGDTEPLESPMPTAKYKFLFDVVAFKYYDGKKIELISREYQWDGYSTTDAFKAATEFALVKAPDCQVVEVKLVRDGDAYR